MLKFGCYLLTFWSILVIITLITLMTNISDYSFFNIGPHDNFIIFGIKINTTYKYFIVITYSFVNSMIRAILNDVINPYIVNNIQNDNVINIIHKQAYYCSAISAVYTWIDWVVYMNILLTQIDMPIIEMLAHLFISLYTTKKYLYKKQHLNISSYEIMEY